MKNVEVEKRFIFGQFIFASTAFGYPNANLLGLAALKPAKKFRQNGGNMRTRNIQLILRLDEREHNKLKQLSEKSGLKINPLLRKMIMSEKIHEKPTAEYLLLLRELSAVGNNINQIARMANSCGKAGYEELAAIRKMMDDLWTKMREG